MTYVGRCKCGAIRAATVDEPGREQDTAKDVAEFIRGGLAIERMETDAVRKASWKCTCPKPVPAGMVAADDLFGGYLERGATNKARR